MKACLAIGLMEFRRLFVSPLAWSVLAVVLFILAWVFLLGLDEYLTQVQPQTAGMENPPGVGDLVIAALYLWAGSDAFNDHAFARRRAHEPNPAIVDFFAIVEHADCVGEISGAAVVCAVDGGYGELNATIIGVGDEFGLGATGGGGAGFDPIIGFVCGGGVVFVLFNSPTCYCSGHNIWLVTVLSGVVHLR